MFPEILIIIILFSILLYLIISFLLSSRQKDEGRTDSFSDDSDVSEDKVTPCPLCEKALHRGERVHSVIYSQGEDRLMNIFGCPWCYSNHPAGHREPSRERYCPSCGVLLKEGSFAVARVFERPGRKTHVHVLGCPVCRNMR
ncbi:MULTISPECIES: hypothetical protein [unclassified Oceanispirochaeta]|uniref:hypothetical protein n=1 Tax=unclassified Oceanispirochaeta TaxID=2635722 RepID=UPI000E0972D9|nr:MULTISPECIES: hypothetical protein [unclassified Oceanispirochaeta]MBF9015384.1 hypothetical protein [Oceanispirochaeta sp. M2]NPD71843.1 hypothetical protein [Oceanispirochaeta sp. M1]RDG32653.1 hypothetical protein DV872_07000 [Oceanispirochaeta sp. M1]